jgi:GNAT superfamily N-acetyltransferase
MILEIINGAAAAYQGTIPPEFWRDPYMSPDQLDREIARGVSFQGIEAAGRLTGVMGLELVRGMPLIRHAYVRPEHQGSGIGGALIEHLKRLHAGPMLVGTWSAALWAIHFYERHDFRLLPRERAQEALRTYWDVSERQARCSVVLARASATAGGRQEAHRSSGWPDLHLLET